MRTSQQATVPNNSRRVSAALLALSCLATACAEPPVEYSSLKPDSRLLREVHLFAHKPTGSGHVVFYPVPEAGWRSLLKLDPCGPFHPGMTIAEAEERFGPPDELSGGAVYLREGVRHLITQKSFSTGSIPFLLPEEDASYEEWVLEAHPLANLVGDVLEPEIAAYVDGSRERFTIMGEEHPAVHAGLNGRRVTHLLPTKWAGCDADLTPD